MKKRTYISEREINSRTDGKGKPFAHRILGKNTSVTITDRLQGVGKYNGKSFNKIIFTITFHDLKSKSVHQFKDERGLQGLLVQYALDLMEDETLEEFYKTALLLTKLRLIDCIASTEELFKKYNEGLHAWPVTKATIKNYRKWHLLDKKIEASIDVTTKDLKYFAQYEREGLQTDPKERFNY